MTQTYSNTKERRFIHLTAIERGQIAAYLDEGLSLREIARRMGRNVSTISREKKRGMVHQMDTLKPMPSIFRTLVHVFIKKTGQIVELIRP